MMPASLRVFMKNWAALVRGYRAATSVVVATLIAALTGVALAQGGESAVDNGFTVALADKEAYKQPAPVLSYQERKIFMLGRSHFKRRWIAPITFNGEWGLGPTFIQTRCSECHITVNQSHNDRCADCGGCDAGDKSNQGQFGRPCFKDKEG